MRLFTIDTGFFKLDGGAMHGVVPKSMWNKINPADENNMCTWAMRCLLIEHDNKRILIDNGMGDKQDAKFFSFYHPHGDDTLLSSLAQHGFKPEDITDVFLTHLHFDHCGGSVKRDGDNLALTFPNATYWSNKAHWELAMNPNEREKASFLKENFVPLQEQGRLSFVDKQDGEEWIKDIAVRFVKGHTDSMMLPQINYNGTTILYCADLLPSVAHVSIPWVMAYDMQPLETLKEKKRILREAVDNNWVLFFEHDPKNECCTLQDENGRIKLKETFALTDLAKHTAK
jgi:glyoxylase-like metal-dependent hydrolase (beta-lactamase superfamily II)